MNVLVLTGDSNASVSLGDIHIKQPPQLAEVLVPGSKKSQDFFGVCDRKRRFGHQVPMSLKESTGSIVNVLKGGYTSKTRSKTALPPRSR